jgi:hypothetical protein
MAQDQIVIIADGKKMGSFPLSQRRSHRHLFNLAGIELVNATTGERIDKGRLLQQSIDEDEDSPT